MNITILEPGAWGTALGIILSKKNNLNFWYSEKNLSTKISKNRENKRLPGTKIPLKIAISSDIGKAIKDAELIIIGSPSFNFRKTLAYFKNFNNLPPFLGIAKGLEKKTLKFPSQIIEETLGKVPYAHLSGPGFAREVVRGKRVKEVIASKDKNLIKKLKKVFDIKSLSVSFSNDVVGVQLAGAAKNALAIGISLVAVATESNKKIIKGLIDQGVKEMIILGKAIGGEKKTFLGPAGKGDLVLTSTNPLSRNFQFGKKLFLNADNFRKDIFERKITVEGFDNAFALYTLSKNYKLDLPMFCEIYKLIYKKTTSEKIVRNLIDLV